MIIDIDHFKLVNDVYGHLAGDTILTQVAQTIRINLKRNDHAFRFGGDEFIVVLPDTIGTDALDLAQRLLFEFRKREVPGGPKISVSIGIAQSRPEDKEVRHLISMADQALYHAKETGRGRFVLADDLVFLKEIEPDFSHMVGRREELQQLRELLDRAEDDSARFCLLTGYQGSGKTKLFEELLNYCQFKNLPVFSTGANQLFQEENFLILSIIRKALDELSQSQLSLLSKAVRSIERSSAEQLAESLFKETQRSEVASPDEKRARSRHDFSVILREISKLNPFVVLVDNLQWASDKCIQYTAEVVLSAPDANILFLFISRNSESFKLLSPVWNAIPSRKIHLKPLDQSDVRTMIFFAMKTHDIPDEVHNFMLKQSGGNSLFLRKLISWGLEKGYLGTGKGSVCLWQEPPEDELPDDISSVIELMLCNCSPLEIKILKTAALVENQLTLELLGMLTSIDEYSIAETMDRFVEEGILKDNGSRYTFSYGVMRSWLISKISPSLRLILHGKTALFLERRDNSEESILAEEIAYHFCNSRNNSKAIEYSRKAANDTFIKGLHSRSIHWYREYLNRTSNENTDFLHAHINIGVLFSITGKAELAEKHLIKALSIANDPVDQSTIYHRLGTNYQRRSMYPQAFEYYEKAIFTGMSFKSPEGVIVTNMIGAHLETSFICRLQNKRLKAESNLNSARALLDRNISGVEKALEGMYYARLADLENETGSPDAALQHYNRGLEICTGENDLAGEALILNNMHDLYSYSGNYNSALDCLKQVIKLNNRLGDQLGLAIAYYNLGETYTELNMLDLAQKYFELYIELNNNIGNRLGMAYGQLGLGKLSMVKGQSHQASEYLLNASRIFGELDCVEMKFDTDLDRVKALLELKDFQSSRDILTRIEKHCSSEVLLNWVLHFRGVLLSSAKNDQNNRGKAVEMIEKSIAEIKEKTPDEIVYMYGNFYRALNTAGNSERIAGVLEEALNFLEDRLSNITSGSIRNSILSRPDIEAFLQICRSRRVASSLINS